MFFCSIFLVREIYSTGRMFSAYWSYISRVRSASIRHAFGACSTHSDGPAMARRWLFWARSESWSKVGTPSSGEQGRNFDLGWESKVGIPTSGGRARSEFRPRAGEQGRRRRRTAAAPVLASLFFETLGRRLVVVRSSSFGRRRRSVVVVVRSSSFRRRRRRRSVVVVVLRPSFGRRRSVVVVVVVVVVRSSSWEPFFP